MLKLYAFGEVLIDFLQDSKAPDQFTRFAGGAPANVAVAFARLGGPAHFVGMLGQDMFADFLLHSLTQQGVNTAYCQRTAEAKTALAFVALDANGERSFSFYRPPAADLLFRPQHFAAAMFDAASLWHLCSNSLTADAIAETSLHALAEARRAGAVISFDANLRHNLWPQGRADKALVCQALRQADVVKLSADELDYLADGDNASWLAKQLDAGVSWLVVTDGSGAVHSFSQGGNLSLAVPKIDVVDTTAAGDAFVGAWLYQLARQLDGRQQLAALMADSSAMRTMLQFAISCGAFACQQQGAFASLPRLGSDGSLQR